MASSSVFARVSLVSVVAVILGIGTLSSLLPASDVKRPSISGPPLYQTAALPVRAERAAARIPATDARPKPAKVTSTAVALLVLPQKWSATDKSTTGLAPLPHPIHSGLAAAADASETPAPPPVVAEAESPPQPEKRAAASKRPKKVRSAQDRTFPASTAKQVPSRPPIYTYAVQMSVY